MQTSMTPFCGSVRNGVHLQGRIFRQGTVSEKVYPKDQGLRGKGSTVLRHSVPFVEDLRLHIMSTTNKAGHGNISKDVIVHLLH